jgi:serine protease Do
MSVATAGGDSSRRTTRISPGSHALRGNGPADIAPGSHALRGNESADTPIPCATTRPVASPSVPKQSVGTRGIGCCLLTLLAVLLLQQAAVASADDDTDEQEQAAFREAVQRVAPSVVQIETVGGMEKVDKVLFGAGPTTGLIVEADGAIVSSAFNFARKPTSILVRLPGGERKPARLVATDHSRMLVLLKIETDKELPVCEIAPRREMRVGQWTIAVGRTFDAEQPNMAVGILSALDRVWGKAVQTDAAVSPNNYGGPLVDVRGRVMGILVPLSPDAASAVAGMEWYDSGIGFAVPMEHVQQVLPRLKKGEDLYPGVMGVTLKAANPVTAEPVVATCRPKSPASAAGLKAGDRIVEIDGRPITRGSQLKEEIGRRYAGDKMRLTVLRGKDRVECEIELVAKLEPFRHGFLGILPMRMAEDVGVTVRYVYPKSPAAEAGIAAGDVVVSLGGKPVQSRVELMEAVGSLEPGNAVELEVRRGDVVRQLKIVLAPLPEELPPAVLPPAQASDAKPSGPVVGATRWKLPEYANEVWAYVPGVSTSNAPQGVVIWLHGPGGFDWKRLLADWKLLCDRHGLILLAPKSSMPGRWMAGDVALIDRLLLEAAAKYNVDPSRVVVHGYQDGAALAFLSAFHNRDAIRAVAAVEAAPPGSPPDNDPLRRLAVYVASAHKSPTAGQMQPALQGMREMKIPVVVKGLGATPRYLNAAELAELVRWIDTLDRI